MPSKERAEKKFVVVGTAGHIDHGKTSLIKALTGIDTDRWKEEKQRGMTIDIGFANLELPSGITAGIVDVPGHERFIKNMLAGAHGIDIVLLVVAADEGVMPQTREHLTVCEMLGTKKGIVVLTKKDLVDEEWLELVKEDLKEFLKNSFLENAPVVALSSKTGEGLQTLIDELDRLASEVEPKRAEGVFRLPVDRVFTIKGFGTVVTGTTISGKVKIGDTLEILPAGKQAKVRTIQVHGKNVNEAVAGQRTAINLSDVSKEELKRGDILTVPGILKPTDIIDVEIKLSKDANVIVTSGFKVHLHHLTADVEGEVFLIDKEELLPGESAFAQIRLKGKIVPVFKDRFVIRNYSPARVIGGGKILNPLPPRRFRKKLKATWNKRLNTLKKNSPEEIVLLYTNESPGKYSSKNLIQLTGLPEKDLKTLINRLKAKGLIVESDGKLYPGNFINSVKGKVVELLEKYHEKYPISEGLNRESIRTKLELTSNILNTAITALSEEGIVTEEEGIVRLTDFSPHAEGTEFEKPIKDIENLLEENLFSPLSQKELSEKLNIPETTVALCLSYLVKRKGFFKAGEFTFHPKALEVIKQLLQEHFKRSDTLSVSEFRESVKTTRKFAVPLLEFCDSMGLTERKGRERIKGKNL